MTERGKFWLRRLRGAGASQALVVHLRMVVRKAVLGLPDAEEMARQLGLWLYGRPDKHAKGNGRKRAPTKAKARRT
jgi:hypothetical protein